MKDGLSRTEKFLLNNGRLPNTVTFGTYNMPIAQFQKIIATQGSKSKPKIAVTSNWKSFFDNESSQDSDIVVAAHTATSNGTHMEVVTAGQ